MSKIVIEVHDKNNLAFLVELLKKFSFVTSIKNEEVKSTETLIAPNGKQISISKHRKDADFSKLAGLWKDNAVTLETIRKADWG